jgi:hypothetical protein
MGSAEKQKQRERFLLDRFLEHRGISPTNIKQPDPPDPDFLIDIDGRKVGIELTRVFVRPDKHPRPVKEPLPQEVESITNWIVSRARKIYFDAECPPVLARIVFSNRITLDKKKGDQIAKLIAGRIQRMGIQNSQVIWRSSEGEREEALLSKSVVSIYAHGVAKLHLARWIVARAGFVHTLTAKHLQDRIDSKAKKINGYKKNTEEIWLLIVADRTLPSQKFMLSPSFPLDSLSSRFARTFYYGYGADGVIEFKSINSGNCDDNC